jgi:2-methylaconitate cis-trans-isomerase PrpF
VPTRGGRFDPEGEGEIPGVPGTGSCIELSFREPAGSLTGRLLPTGRATDSLPVPGLGEVQVSMIDAGTPTVFVRGADVGAPSDASPLEIDADAELLERLEAVRSHAAVAMGIADDPAAATASHAAAPKLVILGSPIDGAAADLRVTAISMGLAHRSLPLTAAISSCAAAAVPGTRVRDALAGRPDADAQEVETRLANPAGVMALRAGVEWERGEAEPHITHVTVERTARRLMDGTVYVPGGG